MNSAILITLLLAGVSAIPTDELAVNNGQERIVTNNIERAVEELAQSIRDAGLDPLKIDLYKYERVSFIGSLKVWTEDLLFSGLSNMKFDSLNYGVITSRLSFNFVLPRISFRVRSTGMEVNLLSRKASAELGGSLEILAPRIIGDMRISIGIISGISISRADFQFNLQDIESNLNVRVQNKDYSDEVNELLGARIPDYLQKNQNEINAWLTDTIITLLDRVL